MTAVPSGPGHAPRIPRLDRSAVSFAEEYALNRTELLETLSEPATRFARAQVEPAPLGELRRNFALSDCETRLVAIAYAVEVDEQFAQKLGARETGAKHPALTPRLLQNVLPPEEGAYAVLFETIGPGGSLIEAGLVLNQPETPTTGFLDNPVRISDRIAAYLSGQRGIYRALAPALTWAEDDADQTLPPAAHEIAAAYANGTGPRILYLPDASQGLAGALAQSGGHRLLRLDLNEVELVKQNAKLRGAVRESTLLGAWLYVSGVAHEPEDYAGQIRILRAARQPVLVAGEPRAVKRTTTGLSELARKETTNFGWEDLILPEEQTRHLRELCARHREKKAVFDNWGFGKKLPYGRGTHAVFYGASGTGKTMAAGIIAQELRLDLFRIDLSSVISKYIGETEKNLAKIFSEAASTNAILFFDEADALFGKRTEVKDAHDRYANIETSYLLQEIERYPGITILASNIHENMDRAFLRRMQFVVDFPFPDEAHRRRLWASFIPTEAPVDPAVDFDFLAKRVKMTGGGLKNIVLNAAFYASTARETIGMKHLIRAVKREYKKDNQIYMAVDFAPYASEAEHV